MNDLAGARPRAAIALLCVLALHLGIMVLLQGAIGARAPRDAMPTPPPRVTLRLLPLPTLPERPAAETPPEPVATARAPTPRAARPRSSVTTPLAITPTPAAAPETVSRAAPAASAPLMPPSLMDTEATRRAIRASARLPALTDSIAAAGAEPRRASAQERLGAEIKTAGKGDCVKGEYLGAGAGLLSLPFLAVAAARGACAQ